MVACPQSMALARTLLALWRAGGSGALHITAGGKQCRIDVVEGAARAATASGDSAVLGDWLLLRGELDLHAHEAALRDSAPAWPIGSWLIARGVATHAAVERALRDQLRARVLAALRWRDVHYQFERAAADSGAPGPEQPMALGELALDAAREAFDPTTFDATLSEHAERRAVASAFGRALLDDPSLFSNASLSSLLRQGASFEQLATACGDSAADRQTLGALCWLAAIVPAADSGGSYQLLLRKRMQLRRRAGAAELLELERDAPRGSTRKALRRLAGRVHPDALGPSASPLLRDVSGELMRALLHAEEQLRMR